MVVALGARGSPPKPSPTSSSNSSSNSSSELVVEVVLLRASRNASSTIARLQRSAARPDSNGSSTAWSTNSQPNTEGEAEQHRPPGPGPIR